MGLAVGDRARNGPVEHRYRFLLGTLLSLLLLVPLVPYGGPLRVALTAMGGIVVLVALGAVWPNRRVRWLALATGAGGAGALALASTPPGVALSVAGHGLTLAFFALVAGTILVHILRVERVSLDAVFGAASVYLLLGLAWGRAFAIVESVVPGSFEVADGAGRAAEPVSQSISALMYCSFMTLTTVGYGDVTPLSPPARALAMLEGLTGQLFIAILVARMVGLHLATELQDRGRRG